MSRSYIVNWMTYNLCTVMQIKVRIRKLQLFDKICSIVSYIFDKICSITPLLVIFLFEAVMSFTNFNKICCSFAENKTFGKSKIAAKIADMLAVAIATVLN